MSGPSPELPDLDEGVVDQLLSGSVAPHEAPPGWERVAALLRAAGRDVPGAGPSPSLLAELVTATGAAPARSRRSRGAVLAAGIAAGLIFAGTGAAAAAGSLPDPVQRVLHDVAGAVGIAVPDVEDHHEPGPPSVGGAQDGEGHGRSDEAPGRPDTPGEPDGPRADEAPGRPGDLNVPEHVELPEQGGVTNAPASPAEHGPPAEPGPPSPPPSVVPDRPEPPAQSDNAPAERGAGGRD